MRLAVTNILDLFGEEKALWTKKGLRARNDTNCWTATYMVFGAVNKSQEYFTNIQGEKMGQEEVQEIEQEKKQKKKQKNSPKVQFEKTNASNLYLNKGLIDHKPRMKLRTVEKKYTTYIKYKMKTIETEEFVNQMVE